MFVCLFSNGNSLKFVFINSINLQNAEEELKVILDEKFHKAIPEISVYLIEGVGNDTRIDYGTGQLSHHKI